MQHQYLYDGMGNQVQDVAKTTAGSTTTYHIYDGHNLQLAKYQLQTPSGGADNMGVLERYLYGSDKLGTLTGTNSVMGISYSSGYTHWWVWGPASKEYEIHDHLGNVRATVSSAGPNSMGMVSVLNYYNYYAFGSYQPQRTYEPGGEYSFGFNGQEKKDDWRGAGNTYDFKFRSYDARIGRFITTDPVAQKYPWNSPYAYAENRVIDGKDLEGLEYKSAADWAQTNIADYSIGFMYELNVPPSFKSLKTSNWKDVAGNTMYCSTTTALAYAQGDAKVAQYLSENGFATRRSDQLSFFKEGGEAHHLIQPKDFATADRGDIVFFQSVTMSGSMSGHVAILGGKPTELKNNSRVQKIAQSYTGKIDKNSFVLQVYTTNAGTGKTTSNAYGTSYYLINKNTDGSFSLEGKLTYDHLFDTWSYKDLSGENLKIQGYGRVDEKKIENKTAEKTEEKSKPKEKDE